MPALALALLVVYGFLAFGVRMIAHVRRTGSTGFKGLRGASGSEWAGGFMLVTAVVLCVVGPALQLVGVLHPLAALDGTNVLTIAGVILLTVALELHVRLVEEPHLLRVHGAQYAAYAARVGRFVPGIGRLPLDGAGPADA